MSPKHTPGPWTFHCYGDPTPRAVVSNDTTFVTANYCIGSGDKLLADIRYQSNSAGYPHVDSLAEFKANADLIAAAPDLLEALRDITVQLAQCACSRKLTADEEIALDAARAAIAKAEGRA